MFVRRIEIPKAFRDAGNIEIICVCGQKHDLDRPPSARVINAACIICKRKLVMLWRADGSRVTVACGYDIGEDWR